MRENNIFVTIPTQPQPNLNLKTVLGFDMKMILHITPKQLTHPNPPTQFSMVASGRLQIDIYWQHNKTQQAQSSQTTKGAKGFIFHASNSKFQIENKTWSSESNSTYS